GQRALRHRDAELQGARALQRLCGSVGAGTGRRPTGGRRRWLLRAAGAAGARRQARRRRVRCASADRRPHQAVRTRLGETALSVTARDEVSARAIGRVRRRLVPFLALLYFVAYLDRVNVGFAALQMNAALGLSASEYGLGAGIFFLGYFVFEVPS